MFKKNNKPSFFERLTGAVRIDDDTLDYNKNDSFLHEEESAEKQQYPIRQEYNDETPATEPEGHEEEPPSEGELTVDVYEHGTSIIVKAMVAGVRPDDLDISITRDRVTIRGKREGDRSVSNENYYHRELYWGSFSRTLLLPEEVDVEEAKAVEKHGLLIITLPKINKDQQTRLKVKVG